MVVALATQPCVGCLPARMFACMPYLAVVKRWAGLLLHRTCDTVQALSRRLISIFPLPTCGCECTCITRFGDLSAHLPTHTAQSTRQLQSLRFEDSAQMLDAAGTPTPLTPHLSSADQSGACVALAYHGFPTTTLCLRHPPSLPLSPSLSCEWSSFAAHVTFHALRSSFLALRSGPAARSPRRISRRHSQDVQPGALTVSKQMLLPPCCCGLHACQVRVRHRTSAVGLGVSLTV